MKKILIFALIVVLMICFIGCGSNESNIVKPVNVYYCWEEVDYNSEMGIIAADQMDFNDWNGRMLAFMNFYISAPVKEGMVSPFPAGASINSIVYQNGALKVQLNLLFSRLSSSELTIACTCISLTLFELTSADSVSFSYQSNPSEAFAVMTRDNLVFKDVPVTN